MRPKCAGYIHTGGGMMNDVELPHPFNPVLNPMNEPSTNQIKQNQTKDHIAPNR